MRRTYSNYGDRRFAAAGPKLWKSLPTELRQADISFQRLKTFLFGCWDRGALWLNVKAAPHKFSYLLTYLWSLNKRAKLYTFVLNCRRHFRRRWLSSLPPKMARSACTQTKPFLTRAQATLHLLYAIEAHLRMNISFRGATAPAGRSCPSSPYWTIRASLSNRWTLPPAAHYVDFSSVRCR